MAGELITLDRQVELQGLLMGPGTPYSIELFNPRVFPDLATGDLGRPQRHGVLSGRDLLRARRIPAKINIVAAGKQAAIDALDALIAAWQPLETDVPLVWRSGEITYRAYGRPRLADVTNYARVVAGTLPIECRFLATDPYLYDNVEQNDDATFPDPTDFYTDEYTDLYEDPLTNGRMLFTNAGTQGASWQVEVTGPWTNPQIQLFDPSLPLPPPIGFLTLDVELDADDTLFIDQNREVIYLNGIIRLDLVELEDTWFTIPPGEWALRVTGEDGSGTAEAWMRSAWL